MISTKPHRHQRAGQVWQKGYVTWVVLGLARTKNPILHCILSTHIDGRIYLAQMGEHHLRKWECDPEMIRIDGSGTESHQV